MSIITQTNENSAKISNSVSDFFHRFKVSAALKKANAVHEKGISVPVIFSFDR